MPVLRQHKRIGGRSLETEKGMHGTPYAMAPDVQTHVPMIAWFSETYRSRSGLDRDCLLKRTGEAYSHDNFFHSILGLLDIQTTIYKPGLDMFKDCRSK